MQIPEKLVERLHKLGLDESFYEMRSRKCILSRQKLDLEKVPWLIEQTAAGHQSGCGYYAPDAWNEKKNNFIFDPVSLVPCLALDPQPGERILDMCAAPGTKTYIIDFMAGGNAHIVANDINKFRIKRLVSNVSKFHISAEVTNESGRKIHGPFDKILLDAPCSGEGMVNKKEKLFGHWSEARIRLMSKKQKKLIKNAFKILSEPVSEKSPGGTLVYSTCTFAPEENEEVIDFLLKKYGNAQVEKIEINNMKFSPGLQEWGAKKYDSEVEKCMRIYPHQNNTGGFFVAKISKL